MRSIHIHPAPFLLVTLLLVSSGPAHAAAPPGNLDYIASAIAVVNEVWIQEGDRGAFEKRVLDAPRSVQLVPASDDVADLLVDLDLPPGAYGRARLVITSGTVELTEDAHVASGRRFSTDLGNLSFPSAAQSGDKMTIDPPVVVVTMLSDEFDLELDLSRSFVFNGPPTHAPGVRHVVFTPVVPVANASTHGRITLRVLKRPGSKCTNPAVPLVATIQALADGVPSDLAYTTDAEGNAVIRLSPGTYDILVKASGYETVRMEGQDVFLANETALGDVELVEEGTRTVFDLDRAKLLAIMSNIAYADGRPVISGTLRSTARHDLLPRLNDPNDPPLILDPLDYSSCWKFFAPFDTTGAPAGGEDSVSTQGFIAYHGGRGDIVVSFTGSSDGWDFETATRASKVSWFQRTAAGEYAETAATEIENAVHRGFKGAYLIVREWLEQNLDAVIDDGAIGVSPSRSRVYFTGHSLGGALATLAALDLSDYLVTKHGYDRHNIIMYSFGTARVITEKLEPRSPGPGDETVFKAKVPNGHAVAARDDWVTHANGLDVGIGASEYTHIGNLVALESNIPDRSPSGDGERYRRLGMTRLSASAGLPYEGCLEVGVAANPVLPPYFHYGHESFQYTKRLENVRGIPNIPFIQMRIVDGSVTQVGDRLQLRWDGGVQGPCDWVGLYATDMDGPAPTDADAYIAFVDGTEYVVNGEGYATEPPSVIESAHTTNKDPSGSTDECRDFWICYVDGFNRIIRSSVFTAHRDEDHDCDEDAAGGRARLSVRPSPSPAIASMELRYAVSKPAEVRLAVFDVAGRLVRELVREARAAGEHVERWDLRDGGGRRVGAGLYFARLEAEGQSLARKITIAR